MTHRKQWTDEDKAHWQAQRREAPIERRRGMRRWRSWLLPAFEVVEVLLDLPLGHELQGLERAVEVRRQDSVCRHLIRIGANRASLVGLVDFSEPPGEEVIQIAGVGPLGLR